VKTDEDKPSKAEETMWGRKDKSENGNWKPDLSTTPDEGGVEKQRKVREKKKKEDPGKATRSCSNLLQFKKQQDKMSWGGKGSTTGGAEVH